MRNPPLSAFVGAAVLSFGLCQIPNVRATTPAPQIQFSVDTDLPLTRVDNASLAATLEQQYAILARADHDYKGHRVKAMKAIEAACKALGAPIKGDGKGHEKQALSDAQLRSVLATVQQVRSSIPGGKGDKTILKHLDTAINELTIALTIR